MTERVVFKLEDGLFLETTLAIRRNTIVASFFAVAIGLYGGDIEKFLFFTMKDGKGSIILALTTIVAIYECLHFLFNALLDSKNNEASINSQIIDSQITCFSDLLNYAATIRTYLCDLESMAKNLDQEKINQAINNLDCICLSYRKLEHTLMNSTEKIPNLHLELSNEHDLLRNISLFKEEMNPTYFREAIQNFELLQQKFDDLNTYLIKTKESIIIYNKLYLTKVIVIDLFIPVFLTLYAIYINHKSLYSFLNKLLA
tara:strand:- start:313 stop:1086 length:774 start_codon:yes stop_codon:yes gene_type:complete